jgi:hypothetical protein
VNEDVSSGTDEFDTGTEEFDKVLSQKSEVTDCEASFFEELLS